MIGLRGLLLILALMCFVLSGLGVVSTRVNLQSFGLAFFILSLLVV